MTSPSERCPQCQGERGSDPKCALCRQWRDEEARRPRSGANKPEPEPSAMGALFKALSAAQAAMQPVLKDGKADMATKKGGRISYTFASLAAVLNAARPALAAHGLALVQWVDEGALVSVLGHASGAEVRARWPLPRVEGGPQAMGSAITYWRRYQAMALLGLAPEDDDGAEAEQQHHRPPEGRAASGGNIADEVRTGREPAAEPPVWDRLSVEYGEQLTRLAEVLTDPEDLKAARHVGRLGALPDDIDQARKLVGVARTAVAYAKQVAEWRGLEFDMRELGTEWVECDPWAAPPRGQSRSVRLTAAMDEAKQRIRVAAAGGTKGAHA